MLMSQSLTRLSGANPSFAEVWFNINEKDRYDGAI